MRRLSTVIVCCAAFQLLTPTPADAWWGWLDEMSGPGPWMFGDLQYRVACVPDRSAEAAAMDARAKNQQPSVIRSLNSFEGGRKILAAISGVGCILQPSVRPRASVNVATAWYVAVANNPRLEGDGRLGMQKYEVTASTFLDRHKIFEAYAGGGVLKGLGKSEFTRGYWTVTGTISPYGAVERDSGRQSLLRTISVNVGVVVVPKGFRASDFAAPGPFRTEGEILKTISITLDFSRY